MWINIDMKFQKLFKIVTEAKGTKPGERYFTASKSAGPSGISSSPIGKDSYNPVIEPRVSKDPIDRGAADAASNIKLLSKAFQVLKNDETFIDQMRGVMNGFKKNRSQISHYQESILKSKPKTIDNIWGDINRLIKVVNNPEMKKHKDHGKYLDELEETKAKKDQHQAEYDEVVEQVENITLENEELNDQFLDQMMVIVENTAKRLYKKYTEELLKDGVSSNKLTSIIPLHELDYDKLEKSLTKDAESQLQLLEMMMADDENINPVIRFLSKQQRDYDEAKNRYFEVKRGDNYSLAIEQLYKTLPLFALINYFSHVILKSPAIKLSKKQSLKNDKLQSGGGVLGTLRTVRNEREFEELKPALTEYINELESDESFKNMMLGIVNGPFKVGNRANAAVKLSSALKADNIEDEETVKESFDNIFSNIIKEKVCDEDDFKINIMEVLSYTKK